VRIRKTVRQEVVPVDHTLRREDWAIERVPANRIVDVAPAPRWEGRTLILPIVEEVLVKQLRLIEEVRITRRCTVDRKTRAVPLHREVITVERKEHSRRSDTPPLADTPHNNGGSDGTDDRGQIRQ
jgi:stress response protein YsnF